MSGHAEAVSTAEILLPLVANLLRKCLETPSRAVVQEAGGAEERERSRRAPEGMQFPWLWYGGTIPLNLGVI